MLLPRCRDSSIEGDNLNGFPQDACGVNATSWNSPKIYHLVGTSFSTSLLVTAQNKRPLINYQWLLTFPLKFHVKFLPPGDQSWGRGRMQFRKLTGKICLKATSTRFKKIPAPGPKPPFHRGQLLGFLEGRLADGYAHGWICNSYCALPSPTEHLSRKNTRNSHAIPYETFQSAARNIPQPFFQQGPQQEQPLAPRGAAQGAMALHCWGLNVADNGEF